MERPVYRSDSEIREVVEKFESCSFALQEFTHARHLTVACWYLSTMPPEQALARMRAGLQRFLAHHGRHGFHETITRFWMELLGEYFRRMPAEMSVLAKINGAVAAHGDKEILFAYYSRDRVMSEEARSVWMEPDIVPVSSEVTK